MTNDNNLEQFGIREYAINGTTSRHQFHPIEHAETLKGSTDCFQSIYLHSSEIEKYLHAQETLSGKPGLTGYRGKVVADTLYIDIDVKLKLNTLTAYQKVNFNKINDLAQKNPVFDENVVPQQC